MLHLPDMLKELKGTAAQSDRDDGGQQLALF